jgi:hypothetical protein
VGLSVSVAGSSSLSTIERLPLQRAAALRASSLTHAAG